ncbi:MAG: NADH-quinone oxidoreductase subunit J [Nitrososphaerales archaeon]
MVDIAFLALAAFTVATSLIALEAKEIVYGAVALGLSFLGIAGFFILLNSPFLAAFQILIYVGAIAVLIIFTVMLVRREVWLKLAEDKGRIVGIFGGFTIVAIILIFTISSQMAFQFPPKEQISFTVIGTILIKDYWFALEILALLLTASVLGALTLAKLEKEG